MELSQHYDFRVACVYSKDDMTNIYNVVQHGHTKKPRPMILSGAQIGNLELS